MPSITPGQLNRYLWHRQGFDRQAGVSVLDIVARSNGLYATSRTAYLSLLARVAGFRFADLDAELYEKQRVIRMCAMRTSIFLIADSMIPAVYQATKDRCLPGRQQFLPPMGITDADYRRIAAQVLDVLAGRRLTVSEIKRALPDLADHEQEALKYVMAMMRAEASIVRAGVRGTWKSDLFEYAHYSEWLPDIKLDALTPEEARIVVTRRYFESFGPATADDLRWWSGFANEDANRALAALQDEVASLEVAGLDGSEYRCLAAELDTILDSGERDSSEVRLLPVWDAYLMAYRERARYIPAAWYDWVFDGSGNCTSVVVDQSGVMGVWDMVEDKKTLTVKVFLFDAAEEAWWGAVHDEAARLAEAVGLNDLRVLRCPAPLPLNEGGPNQFRTPLKDVEGKPV